MMVTKSDRTLKIEAAEVDPDEDILTRGVRSGAKKIGYAASRAGDYVGAGAHAIGEYLNPKNIKDANAIQKHIEAGDELNRETRGEFNKNRKPLFKKFKSGGKISSASKRADGCAQKGKTKGRMV